MVEAFSPRPVDQGDLYDGPEPSNVSAMPPRPPRFAILPDESNKVRDRAAYVATITAALDMLGARILALIAVIAACLMWGWAVYNPDLLRTYASVGFSVTVLLPTVALYWRRG